MVKNKDKLIEKAMNEPIKNPESIKEVKEKMKETLDKVAMAQK